jgi:hypothetical protein
MKPSDTFTQFTIGLDGTPRVIAFVDRHHFVRISVWRLRNGVGLNERPNHMVAELNSFCEIRTSDLTDGIQSKFNLWRVSKGCNAHNNSASPMSLFQQMRLTK